MSNKMALDALTAAIEAMESCEEGDYSTGHVCHPSFDSDAIDAAIEQARAAIAALQAEPVEEVEDLKRAYELLFKENAAIRAEVERLAAQAAPSEQADLRQLMGMNEAEIDTELIAAGISPDDAVKRADRAIKEALATIRAERRASSGATTPAAPFAKDSWQHAVDNQLVAFGRTSQEFANPHEALAWLAIMNMELGQSNAGATTQAVRMLTEYEQAAIIDMHSTGRAQGDHECAEAIQRKFCEVNNLRIPADGKIGDAA